MIQRAADGTLSYTAPDGTIVSAGVMDSTGLYSSLEATESVEEGQELINNQNRKNYETDLANAQLNIDAGRSVPPPPKPLMAVVNDATGLITYTTEWTPPLEDLKISTIPVNATVVLGTQDLLSPIYRMVTALYNQAFPKK